MSLLNQWPITSGVTDKVTLGPLNAGYEKSSLPDRITIRGTRYTRWLAVANVKDIRKRKSTIWASGEQLVKEKDGVSHYFCYHCEAEGRKQELFVVNGNTGPLHHLLRDHGIDKDGNKVHRPANKGVVSTMVSLVTNKSLDRFKRLLVRWIVYCHVAFRMLENAYFRELVAFMNNGLSAYLPRAASTIRTWILEEYAERKEALNSELYEALSDIHISFDGWSSPNSYSIISVNAHFIDKGGKRRTERLAFRRMLGEHTGNNIAAALLAVITEWSIRGRVGYFMADNAANNDVAIDAVLRAVYPKMPEKQRKARRLRCLGHITNLIAKAMLLGKGGGKAMAELDRNTEKGAFEKVESFWRNRGAIGRLHNIIKWIRASTQRLEAFEGVRCSGAEAVMFNDLRLIQDNSTRWNSFYYMLSRAWSLRERITEFCRLHRTEKTIRDNTLTPNDWDQIDRLHNALHVFELTTMTTQGNQKHLYDWYPTLQFTLDYTSKFSTEFKEEAELDERFGYLSACCDHAWQKAEKYWKLTDDTPLVYAAVVLNPTLKHGWFEDLWSEGDEEQQGYILQVRKLVKELWISDYRPSATPLPLVTTTAVDSEDLRDHLYQYKRRKVTTTGRVDALDNYLSIDCVTDTKEAPLDVLQWWFDRRYTEPELSKFAFDTLALPLQSDEPERSFSAGRDMITYRRSRLQEDVIEACSCLRSWYGAPSKDAFDSEPIEQWEVAERGTEVSDGVESSAETAESLFVR